MYKTNIDTLQFQWINMQLGLKFLNGNSKLYLSILENFFNRYHRLDLQALGRDERKETLHAMKGLSSTLGMSRLADATEALYRHESDESLHTFTELFRNTLEELKLIMLSSDETQYPYTVLIMEEEAEIIDEMIQILDDQYDVLVALDIEGGVSILEEETVDLLICSESLSLLDTFSSVAERLDTYSIVRVLDERAEMTQQEGHCCITQPFEFKELLDCVETQLKLKTIFKNLK